MIRVVEETIALDDANIQTARWGPAPADIVMLHDGLGSVSQWRDVPARIASVTGRTVIAYDRPGHGGSTPFPDGPWQPDWLDHEAERLAGVLAHLAPDRPLLVGHSDGASIALIHTSAEPCSVAGVVSLAAHSYVEPICVDAIAAMRRDPAAIVGALGRHHEHPNAVFDAWTGVWTSDEFAGWDIRPRLASIRSPVLVVQGSVDEYGTDAMALETTAAIGPDAECRLLPGLGHLLHHQAPDSVVELVVELAGRVLP